MQERRDKQKNIFDQAREELEKSKPSIPRLRKLLGVELKHAADRLVFNKPSVAAGHVLEPKRKKSKQTKKRRERSLPLY